MEHRRPTKDANAAELQHFDQKNLVESDALYVTFGRERQRQPHVIA